MNSIQKVQLSGPDKTVTWIWLAPAGGKLKVEYYDFSETAQKLLGMTSRIRSRSMKWINCYPSFIKGKHR